MFFALFEYIFGLKFHDSASFTDPERYTALIAKMSSLIGAPIEYLRPEELAEREPSQVYHLLQIFEAAQRFLPVQTFEVSQQTDELQDPLAGCCFGKSRSPSPSKEDEEVTSTAHKPPAPNGDQRARSISSSLSSLDTPEQLSVIDAANNNNLVRSDTQTLRFKSKARTPSLRLEDRAQALAEQLKYIRRDTFALELGLKLQEALKLERKAAAIERAIDDMYELQHEPLKARVRSASSDRSRPRTRSKSATKSPKSPKSPRTPKRKVRPASVTANSSQASVRSQRVDRAPSLDSFLEKYTLGVELPRETKTQLRMMEKNHRAFIDNLVTDMHVAKSKATLNLADAIDRELARAAILKADIDRVERLERDRRRVVCSVTRTSLMREERLSRAKLINDLNEYHRQAASKYASARSRQERLAKEQFAERLANEKKAVLEAKKNLKEKQVREMRRDMDKLEAVANMYRDQRQAVIDAIERDRADMKTRIGQNARVIYDARKLLAEGRRGLKPIGSDWSLN